MKKNMLIEKDYLAFPICMGKNEKNIEVFRLKADMTREKVFEFNMPVDEQQADSYACDYFAEIPVKEFHGEQFIIQGDVSEAFANGIENRDKSEWETADRPILHFTPHTGWCNDPNGLIYDNGVYHLYFQHNPFDVVWNNMCWGHAVSTDLLHWQQLDDVMFPDKDGTVFSGCAIKNDREMLNLPKDALLFFYTAAGGTNQWSKEKDFTQKIAYSLDGGKTLIKMDEPCLPNLCEENRDPKIFWHEETQAYIMVLFLKEHDFAIFRSGDLLSWEQTDQLTLADAWECPDLFRLTADDGSSYWFFWSADGFYFQGEFDGYRFQTDGIKRHAYLGNLPYAAQTYSGVTDRLISIPWLRTGNDGRTFAGAHGIPIELTCKKTENGYTLVQQPVRELFKHAKKVENKLVTIAEGSIYFQAMEKDRAYLFRMTAKNNTDSNYHWIINGSHIEYRSESGEFCVDDMICQAGCGHKEFLFLMDDKILEVFLDNGEKMGAFVLQKKDIEFEMCSAPLPEFSVYELE